MSRQLAIITNEIKYNSIVIEIGIEHYGQFFKLISFSLKSK